MSRLPVIVGFGGINAAGRSSFHAGYRRLVIDKLAAKDKRETLLGLATMMNLARVDGGQFISAEGQTLSEAELLHSVENAVLEGSLIRKISEGIYPSTKPAPVNAAGQLPSGFEPGKIYASRHHPRALQMSIFAASDCIKSTGIPWEIVRNHLPPDQIAVYATSSMGQLDDDGLGGMLKAPSIGKRTSSKQCPLGFPQMVADFVNAYVLGSVGATGGTLGACATFLYNLEHAVRDIQSGARRFVLVGAAEAPVVHEVMEGYRAMGALAEDEGSLKLDAKLNLSEPNYRRNCRPFNYNCGFTMGESAQFICLMDDELAIELGAQIHGAIGDVYIHADGYKKSISSPGIGNYVSFAKAASFVQTLLGKQSLVERSFVQAHGTGTPQNRVTESHIFNETAKAFDIPAWKVAAIKCYVGHSLGAAGGDQMMASLGVWKHGLIPGIFTLDNIADDVHHSNLDLSQTHHEVGATGMDSVLLNSKGFGGNNATAVILAPHIAEAMLTKKHGAAKFSQLKKNQEQAINRAHQYEQAAVLGDLTPIYEFGHNVVDGEQLSLSAKEIRIPGFEQAVSLSIENPYSEFC